MIPLEAGRGPGLAEAPGLERETPAWPWPSFALRWLLTPLFGGDRRCGARRCGLHADGWRRFCPIHHDAVAARFGAGSDTRRAAEGRLARLPRGTRRRIDAWLDSMVSVGSVNLVADGFDVEAYEAVDGIVVGPGAV